MLWAAWLHRAEVLRLLLDMPSPRTPGASPGRAHETRCRLSYTLPAKNNEVFVTETRVSLVVAHEIHRSPFGVRTHRPRCKT